MMFGKVTPLEEGPFRLETVSCEDCRFVREENKKGEEMHICLAHARRRIDPKVKKECQRFLRNTPSQQRDFVEPENPIKEDTEFFDIKPLYELISGQGR